MAELPMSTAAVAAVIAEPIPRAAILTAWWNQLAAGRCAPDDLLDAMALFGTHQVTTFGGEQVGLIIGLSDVRRGRDPELGARVVLPVPGDPTGLPGPPQLNMNAIDAGQAIVLDPPKAPTYAAGPSGTHRADAATAVMLVPTIREGLTTWTVVHSHEPRTVDIPIRPEQASTAIRGAVHTATATLAALDLGTGRELVRDSLESLDKRLSTVVLPPTLAGVDRHTALSSARVLGIVTIATTAALAVGLPDPKVALVLNELGVTARRCLAAACSSR